MRRASRAAAVSVLLAIAVSCGIPVDDAARVDDDANVPSGLLDIDTVTTTTPPAADGAGDVTVCLVGRDGRLVTAVRRVAPPASARSALTSLGGPPSTTERAAGLSSALTADLAVADTSEEAGVATVELSGAFTEASAADQLVAIAQIVCTLTAQAGIGQVRFEIANTTANVPRGDGSTTSEPVTRQDYPQLMPTPPAG